MRTLLIVLLATVAIDAAAQSTARARPQGTLPLDEAPPPPAIVETDPSLEQQQVTMRTEGGQTIEEHRVGGKLVMQRVTPRHGRSYVLMDHRGDGTLTRQDNTLDVGVRVPQWVLLDF
ncbi:MAG TPA: DUF2782 domain-containing protein [Usitatibacter sp.]|nr:DUF2782 domain-containing protein [Usitatibacter sp.]